MTSHLWCSLGSTKLFCRRNRSTYRLSWSPLGPDQIMITNSLWQKIPSFKRTAQKTTDVQKQTSKQTQVMQQISLSISANSARRHTSIRVHSYTKYYKPIHGLQKSSIVFILSHYKRLHYSAARRVGQDGLVLVSHLDVGSCAWPWAGCSPMLLFQATDINGSKG